MPHDDMVPSKLPHIKRQFADVQIFVLDTTTIMHNSFIVRKCSHENGRNHFSVFSGWTSSLAIICFSFSCPAESSGNASFLNAGKR